MIQDNLASINEKIKMKKSNWLVLCGSFKRPEAASSANGNFIIALKRPSEFTNGTSGKKENNRTKIRWGIWTELVLLFTKFRLVWHMVISVCRWMHGGNTVRSDLLLAKLWLYFDDGVFEWINITEKSTSQNKIFFFHRWTLILGANHLTPTECYIFH